MGVSHNKLYRNFIILQEDEKAKLTSSNKALSGYAKVETKGDKCKISFYAQNLKQESKYSMVLICCKKESKHLLNLGLLTINEVGKGDTSKEYYINNIAGLGISYDKIVGAAICKPNNGENIFLMYGFMNGEEPKENWKNFKMIKEEIQNKEKLEIEMSKDQSIKFKSENKESMKDKKEELKSKNKLKIDMELEDSYDKKDKKDNKKCKDEEKKEKQKKEIKEEKKEKDILTKGCSKIIEDVKNDSNCIGQENHKRIEENSIIDATDSKEYEKDTTSYDYSQQNNSRRIEENSIIDGADFEQYEKDIEKIKSASSNDFNIQGKIGEYFEQIADGFDKYSQELDGIKYCKWYNIPVDGIDDLCNISNYNKYTLAYYPMLNYYPYINKNKHFLLGYKCDAEGELKYIVYGIQGSKDISDQPYEGKTGFVTWTNNEMRDEGYWLMFYDFKNSTIVVPMQ
ncbi:hypothetical protein [Clostridium weizhouense]|uniref:Transmembrane protein n=1 Tax=Clostridium weizhouense TaxID=2859781 RepID=A0ABS7AR15_9CLOT|nr:hypothetical protein [Clostridium weizhouense]MBW6411111.1 hypothetical protein [Clostridium weizhouense]